MTNKVFIIADQDDVDDFKQRLDLIYTELSELNEMIRETKKEIDTSYEGEEL